MKAKKKLRHKLKLKKKAEEPITIQNDGLWYYFNLNEKNLEQIAKIGQDSINDARKQYFTVLTAPNIKKNTVNNRSVLKDYYKTNTPVYWIATA